MAKKYQDNYECFAKHDLSIMKYYVMHRNNSEIQNALVSKRSVLLSWKIVNRYKIGTSSVWWG